MSQSVDFGQMGENPENTFSRSSRAPLDMTTINNESMGLPGQVVGSTSARVSNVTTKRYGCSNNHSQHLMNYMAKMEGGYARAPNKPMNYNPNMVKKSSIPTR